MFDERLWQPDEGAAPLQQDPPRLKPRCQRRGHGILAGMRHYYTADEIREAEAPLLASAARRRADAPRRVRPGHRDRPRTGRADRRHRRAPGLRGRRLRRQRRRRAVGGDVPASPRARPPQRCCSIPNARTRQALAAFTRAGRPRRGKRPGGNRSGDRRRGRHLRLRPVAARRGRGVRRRRRGGHPGGGGRHPQRRRRADRRRRRPARARRADRDVRRPETRSRPG